MTTLFELAFCCSPLPLQSVTHRRIIHVGMGSPNQEIPKPSGLGNAEGVSSAIYLASFPDGWPGSADYLKPVDSRQVYSTGPHSSPGRSVGPPVLSSAHPLHNSIAVWLRELPVDNHRIMFICCLTILTVARLFSQQSVFSVGSLRAKAQEDAHEAEKEMPVCRCQIYVVEDG
jgi:hypothetical protein